jgi:hypothetical protein
VLTVGDALAIDLGDVMARDPEVRQARMIAEAARTRLVACMSSPDEEIDLVEAQGMLDALRNARMLAEDAEDRVLLHRGLLTLAAADKRAARRRTASTRSGRSDEPGRPKLPSAAPRFAGRPSTRRLSTGRLIAAALVLVLAGVAGVTLARRCGVRLPLARW